MLLTEKERALLDAAASGLTELGVVVNIRHMTQVLETLGRVRDMLDEAHYWALRAKASYAHSFEARAAQIELASCEGAE